MCYIIDTDRGILYNETLTSGLISKIHSSHHLGTPTSLLAIFNELTIFVILFEQCIVALEEDITGTTSQIFKLHKPGQLGLLRCQMLNRRLNNKFIK